jgi:hypothetical protein
VGEDHAFPLLPVLNDMRYVERTFGIEKNLLPLYAIKLSGGAKHGVAIDILPISKGFVTVIAPISGNGHQSSQFHCVALGFTTPSTFPI